MKAAFYAKNGPARDVLEVGEMPDPVLGAGQVLVRLHVSGVNPSDTKTRQGQPGRPMDGNPRIPHNDGAGVIEAVGVGVAASRLGERVWVHNTGFKRVLGTAAELLAVEAENAVPLPDNLDFEAGACLGVPLLTAYHGVTAAGPVAGKWVFVSGGAGAVGNFAVRIAKALGARVIASVSGADKAVAALSAGADVVINYRTEDVVAAVAQATAGRGVDHLVEVNIAANAHLFEGILAKGASVAVYGSGESVVPLDTRFMRVRLISLRFFNVYELPAATLDAAKEALLPMLASGQIVPRVAARFTLADIASAHEAVEQGALIGNAVVLIG